MYMSVKYRHGLLYVQFFRLLAQCVVSLLC